MPYYRGSLCHGQQAILATGGRSADVLAQGAGAGLVETAIHGKPATGPQFDGSGIGEVADRGKGFVGDLKGAGV